MGRKIIGAVILVVGLMTIGAQPPNEQVEVSELAIDPANQFIAAGNENGQIIVWSLEKGVRLSAFAAHDGRVRGLKFLPNSDHLLSGGLKDAQMKLWLWQGKKMISSFGPNGNGVVRVNYIANGFVAEDFSGTRRLWSYDGKLLKALKGEMKIRMLAAISKDGKFAAMPGQNGILIMDQKGETTIDVIKPKSPKISEIAFSEDSGYLIAGYEDGKVDVWLTTKGFPLYKELQ